MSRESGYLAVVLCTGTFMAVPLHQDLCTGEGFAQVNHSTGFSIHFEFDFGIFFGIFFTF